MAFDFDTGSEGSGGPWIQWSARGTQDGEIGPKSFLLRTKEGKEPFAGFDRGVVLDIENMKTGWCYSDGQSGIAPKWQWNPSVSTFAPKPGEDYKKGFSIPCAISKTETATWEQSGAAAWNAFVGIVPALRGDHGGKLPMVKVTGSKVEKFARGSTVTPILEVVKWVDRPDSLKAGFDTVPEDDAPATKAQKAAPPPASDLDEF